VTALTRAGARVRDLTASRFATSSGAAGTSGESAAGNWCAWRNPWREAAEGGGARQFVGWAAGSEKGETVLPTGSRCGLGAASARRVPGRRAEHKAASLLRMIADP